LKVDIQGEVTLRQTLVGQRLRGWREKAKMSQGDVAKKLQYSSPQFISNWERGLSLPPIEVLPKLLNLYSLSPVEITDVFFKYQEKQLEAQRINLMNLLKAES
jgi:transcriptional regulator with XRE-family HTH domain